MKHNNQPVPTKKYIRTLKSLGFSEEVIGKGRIKKRGGTSHKVWVNGGGVRINSVFTKKETSVKTLRITGSVLEHHNIVGSSSDFVQMVRR